MKRSAVRFLEVTDAEEAHAMALARHGGMAGVRDRRLLESAVMAARSGYYVTLAEVAAAYAHGLAKNHAFVDGNKRVALACALAFLASNGFDLGRLDRSWVATMVGVAAGDVSRAELAARFAVALGGAVPLDDDT